MELNNTTRGVVWEGISFEMLVRSLPIPNIQVGTDALVRVTASAICGSDLHFIVASMGVQRYHRLWATKAWAMCKRLAML